MVENVRGLKILVLSGELSGGGEKLEAQGWGRRPAGIDLIGTAGLQGRESGSRRHHYCIRMYSQCSPRSRAVDA